jgi:hypothetical protein
MNEGVIGFPQEMVPPNARRQVFSSSGLFYPRQGSQCFAMILGAGGGGGGGASGYNNSFFAYGGNGGAGGSSCGIYFPMPSSPVAVTVGAGGLGGVGASLTSGSSAGSAGGAGGISSFGSISAPGGAGGAGAGTGLDNSGVLTPSTSLPTYGVYKIAGAGGSVSIRSSTALVLNGQTAIGDIVCGGGGGGTGDWIYFGNVANNTGSTNGNGGGFSYLTGSTNGLLANLSNINLSGTITTRQTAPSAINADYADFLIGGGAGAHVYIAAGATISTGLTFSAGRGGNGGIGAGGGGGGLCFTAAAFVSGMTTVGGNGGNGGNGQVIVYWW